MGRFAKYFEAVNYNDVEIDPTKIKAMLPRIPPDEFPPRLYNMIIKQILTYNTNVIVEIC